LSPISRAKAAVRRTRILLVALPPMLSDIVADTIGSQTDMEVVGELPTAAELQAGVSEAVADIVIIGLDDLDLPSECLGLFDAYPSIRVLGVSIDGRSASLYELRPHRLPLGEVSPDGLVQAIREARTRVGVRE
jgi:DNA-binding NarL/FixJ family response regulator